MEEAVSANHPNRSKQPKVLRWADICLAKQLLGELEDTSKGPCLRLANQLEARVKAGKVQRLKRGFYQLVVE